jgi:hypothetical protein
MRVAILLLLYVPSWCAGQVHLYFDNELKTSEIGQCEILKSVKNYVLLTAENTFMVKELHSSRLLCMEQWQFITNILAQPVGPILSIQESKRMVSTKLSLI